MYYKIGQLILTPGKKASTTSDIYIAQPDAVKETLAGKLFILAEIESKRIDSLKIINFLVDNLNHNYYQNEKIIMREKVFGLKIEHIFEAALAKTNGYFSEFLYSEKIKINLSAINITVGILHENMLYFANAGKNRILLLYKNARGANATTDKKSLPGNSPPENLNQATGEYAIADIGQQAASNGNETKDKGKLFTNVISGQIPPQGHFFITSEAVPEYISQKQIIDIVTTLPPLSAVEQMKTTLAKINAYVSFLGIIIKSTALEKPVDLPLPLAKTTDESIVNLNATETATEDLLTPSGVIAWKKWTKFLTVFSRPQKKGTPSADMPLKLGDRMFMKKNNFLFFKKISRILKYPIINGINILFYLVKTAINRQKIEAATFTAGHKFTLPFGRFVQAWRRLNFKGRILLVFFGLLIMALVLNLTFIKKRNLETEKEKAIQELAAMIEQKQNQAEANLLYNNEDGASKLFGEIESLLGQYPQETAGQKQQLAAFREKFEAQLEKIRRIIKINDPVKLSDFSALNTRAQPDNIIYLEKNKRIYAADASDKSVYILNTTDKLITTLADLSQPVTGLSYPIAGSDGNIYYYNDNSFIVLNTQKETLSSLPLDSSPSAAGYAGAAVYADKYYLLSKDGKIFRLALAGGKITNPISWLQEDIDFGQVVSLSIDGHIYVLNENGEIFKLLRGKKVEFNIGPVDPPLSRPNKLFVSPEQKFVYILESANRRLVLFDKSGQFLRQYQMPGLLNLKDFFVDEQNKKIYLLDSSSVYSLPADHFDE
ncbi:MAG: 6-bladed beta-propeller [Planctomycetes bacterium]|jgi:hypothetical protein|nr:6-bladed beta-propeller [Planctomycetota bacterium]